MLPFNKSYKNRKVSLTIHCKYKYLDSTAQRAEDRRQKFYFCRLPFAVNVKLNLTIEKFYSDLYKADSLTPSENLLSSFLENPEIPRLTAENAQAFGGKLTVDECLKSLQLFENNKSPGDDGLTAEFYKVFWNIVGNLMVESLIYSYDHGELSNSQKRAIITLIEKKKKDKDRRVIANWRPISLINVVV